MSFVPGNTRLLTPDEAKAVLAIPCLRILVGDAQPVFPTRNRGNWSPLVCIFPIRLSTSGPVTTYPVVVDGRQWERAVVPVLLDPQWQVSNSVIRTALTGGQQQWLLDAFGNAIRASFQAAGYGPAEVG